MNLVIYDRYSFFLERALHGGWGVKMMFAGEQAGAVDNSVRRHALRTSVHRPAYHPRAGLYAEIPGDRTVAGNLSFWNKLGNLVHVTEKIVGRLRLFNTCHPVSNVHLSKFASRLPIYLMIVKCSIVGLFVCCVSLTSFGQETDSVTSQNVAKLILPDSAGWNIVKENEILSFQVKTSDPDPPFFSLEGGDNLNIKFDSLGNFHWQPSYDLVDRVTRMKDFTIIIEASWPHLPNSKRVRESVTFVVSHVNRPPVVEEMPVFYVKQSNTNTYQFPPEFVYDQDGDPLVFKSILDKMPEGSLLSSQGQFSWNPSRSQFMSMRKEPLVVEFIVQDQPEKAETVGKLKIAPTQQDLPPEILLVPGVPGDSVFSIKEDETLNLKIYVSDPNGDDDVSHTGFVSNDKRVPATALKSNTSLQYEFTWSPGYEYVDEVNGAVIAELVFFVLDKSNNRTQRKARIKVSDAENLIKKDAQLFQKYKNYLVEAGRMVKLLDENQKHLNKEYKRARRGKQNRSIINASLGAVTGLSPVVIEAQNESKIVSGIGGTTVLTLGTLEATEVIGRSKEGIMEKIKIGIDIRNKVQSAGDEFARKYALKSTRRNPEFDKDIEKLRATLSDPRIVLLELDAYERNVRVEGKDLKRIFLDYGEDSR